MIKTALLLLLFINTLLQTPLKAEESLFSISFGDVSIGANRIPIKLSDFKLFGKNKNKNIKAFFIKNSVQWVRTKNNLLVPRARIALKGRHFKNIHFKYLGQTIIPVFKHKKYHYSEIYMGLFNPGKLEVYEGENLIEIISLKAKKTTKLKDAKLIDYSCSRYNVQVRGLENEYFSLGCQLSKTGHRGKEKPRLQVTWAATNFTLLNGQTPPYTAFLNDNSPVHLTVLDKDGLKRKITITAKLPKRLKRLKTAVGLGPYMFEAKENGLDRDPQASPAFMLYAKYDFNFTTSLRAFDALVFNESVFNNSGLYFAYELADAMDKRISLVPLLGAQGLSYRYNKKTKFKHDFIFPQGFELVFKHVFGIENYNVVYGMFLSTSSTITYDNLWLRWGKGYFWELNFIRWGQGEQKASMYGISIGLPLASFL